MGKVQNPDLPRRAATVEIREICRKLAAARRVTAESQKQESQFKEALRATVGPGVENVLFIDADGDKVCTIVREKKGPYPNPVDAIDWDRYCAEHPGVLKRAQRLGYTKPDREGHIVIHCAYNKVEAVKNVVKKAARTVTRSHGRKTAAVVENPAGVA